MRPQRVVNSFSSTTPTSPSDWILVSSLLWLPASCSGLQTFSTTTIKKKIHTLQRPIVRFSKAALGFYESVGTAACAVVLVCICRESDGWSARGQAHARTCMLNVLCGPPSTESAACHGFTWDVSAPSRSRVSLVTAANTISVGPRRDQDVVKTREGETVFI